VLRSFLIDHDLQCFPEVSTDHQQQCQDETKPRYILLKLGCRLDLFRVRGDQNEESIGVQRIIYQYIQKSLRYVLKKEESKRILWPVKKPNSSYLIKGRSHIVGALKKTLLPNNFIRNDRVAKLIEGENF
jgi:hypothetical protein